MQLEVGKDEEVLGILEFSELPSSSLESFRESFFGAVAGGAEASYLELIHARRHYFSTRASSKLSEEYSDIIKEFESSYEMSNVSAVMNDNEEKKKVSNSSEQSLICEVDEDEMEEIVLPQGDTTNDSIVDFSTSSTIQIDNYVDDNLSVSEESGYTPSFTAPSALQQDCLPQSTEESSDNEFDHVSEKQLSLSYGSNFEGLDKNRILHDGISSGPIGLSLPIEDMNIKMTREKKIWTDADIFLEHYIRNLSQDSSQLLHSKSQNEIVVDDAGIEGGSDELETPLIEPNNEDEDVGIPLRAQQIMREFKNHRFKGEMLQNEDTQSSHDIIEYLS